MNYFVKAYCLVYICLFLCLVWAKLVKANPIKIAWINKSIVELMQLFAIIMLVWWLFFR